MTTTYHTAEEISRRGEELYQRDLQRDLEARHPGRFLVLDILSGFYEVADDDATATLRLLARKQDAVTYGVRIGERDAYRLGRLMPQQP